MIGIGALAQRMGDLAIGVLGGNRPITLRHRVVVRDQVTGVAVLTLRAARDHEPGEGAVTVSCRATDGALPAGCGLQIAGSGEQVTVYQATRLAPPSVDVPLVVALAGPITAGIEITVTTRSVDLEGVPALRVDSPSEGADAGVSQGRTRYQVSASVLPYRIDETWLVVDGGVTRRIASVQPLYAGGVLRAWRIAAEGAG